MYRVEAATRGRETYRSVGPLCREIGTALHLLDTWADQPTVTSIRIRDLDRDPAIQDPIILALYYLHSQEATR